MQRFYEHLLRASSPAEALRAAKTSVRRSHPDVYRDPGSWAAFTLTGLGGHVRGR
jgi:CHAT domain-containing protein